MIDKRERWTIVFGALLGALSGALLAVLLRRWRQQRRIRGGKPLQARQVVRLAGALVPAVRQLLDLLT